MSLMFSLLTAYVESAKRLFCQVNFSMKLDILTSWCDLTENGRGEREKKQGECEKKAVQQMTITGL